MNKTAVAMNEQLRITDRRHPDDRYHDRNLLTDVFEAAYTTMRDGFFSDKPDHGVEDIIHAAKQGIQKAIREAIRDSRKVTKWKRVSIYRYKEAPEHDA